MPYIQPKWFPGKRVGMIVKVNRRDPNDLDFFRVERHQSSLDDGATWRTSHIIAALLWWQLVVFPPH